LVVVVRKRPLNRREVQQQQQDVVICRNSAVIVREPKLKVDLTKYVEEHNFLFDQSFDETVTNEQLYLACVRPVIDAVFQRAKCTCFAYGQTGSGKTFTMMGPNKKPGETLDDKNRVPGIFLLAAQDIFRGLNTKEHSHLGVYIAFYEIYCGKLFDLLNNRQLLHARENAKSNVVIVGLQEHPVANVQELMEVIEFGLNSRTTGVTASNVDSSRSHAILQISLRENRGGAGAAPGAASSAGSGQDGRSSGQNGRPGVEHGKISFIDLAGSERGADTLDTDRQTRMDGAEINKSLLALKECIRALDQQLDHTPFRGSKLTQVLKDSFIGSNCRTVMIANVSPNSCSVEHSLNTLRYAYRVKELRSASGRPAPLPGAGGDIGSFCDHGPMAANAQGELPAEEEEELLCNSGDEDGSAEGGVETPPPVSQQQLRVASLHSDTRLFEPLPRAGGVGSLGSGAGSGISGAGLLDPQPEEVLSTIHHPQAVPVSRYGAGADAGTGGALPPEVALEPVGCSQAALDELARQHDQLIGTILAEEEDLITAHRQHIDMMVELIKEEMVHLNSVDRPGSDVDAYVAGLDRILRLKAQYIGDIRQRVDLFKDHLHQEDTLSRQFQSLASSS
jgi:kinesin family protein 2/24